MGMSGRLLVFIRKRCPIHIPGSCTLSNPIRINCIRLKFNPLKTEVLYLSYRGPESGIQLPDFNGAPLVLSSEVKSVGMVLDASLSMGAQVTTTIRSVFYHLKLVKQLVPYLDFQD